MSGAVSFAEKIFCWGTTVPLYHRQTVIKLKGSSSKNIRSRSADCQSIPLDIWLSRNKLSHIRNMIITGNPRAKAGTARLFEIGGIALDNEHAQNFSRNGQYKIGKLLTLLKNFSAEDWLPIVSMSSNALIEMLGSKCCTQQISSLFEHTVRRYKLSRTSCPLSAQVKASAEKFFIPKSVLLEYLKSSARRFLIRQSTFDRVKIRIELVGRHLKNLFYRGTGKGGKTGMQ